MSSNLGNYIFKSQFADAITDYIRERRGAGFKYSSEERYLKHFDDFIVEHGFPDESITKEIFKSWTTLRPHERVKTRENKVSILKGLCKYIVRMGGNAYVPQRHIRLKDDVPYRAHIYTADELSRFIYALDHMKGKEVSRVVYGMLFRILICTGLRISEATELRKKDISFEDDYAILSIRNAKYDKERLIPLTKEMSVKLQEYLDEINILMPDTDVVFPSSNGKARIPNNVYVVFRRILWDAGISHGGSQYGPRMHDFRHTFAVRSLRKLVQSGEDIRAVIPLLSKYLGHQDIYSTQVYLQFTVDMFPHVISQVEQSLGDIVPRKEELCENLQILQ